MDSKLLNPFMNGLKMCALIQVPISLNDCTTPFLKPSQVNFPASVKCFIIYFLASATAFLKIPPINAAKPPNAAQSFQNSVSNSAPVNVYHQIFCFVIDGVPMDHQSMCSIAEIAKSKSLLSHRIRSVLFFLYQWF